MRIDVLDYYAKQDWQLMKQEADRHPTPFLVVNLNIVKMKYEELLQHFPFSRIYYAVKANPATEVLELLRDLGSCFDIASRYELDRVLSLGIEPERVSYGNTIKKPADIRYFYEKGVRLFATDSEADLRNIAKEAPGARVFCRILTEGVFGIRPTGFRSFTLTPRLPAAWDRMNLRNVRAFGSAFDIEVRRAAKGMEVAVTQDGREVVRKRLRAGQSLGVTLK